MRSNLLTRQFCSSMNWKMIHWCIGVLMDWILVHVLLLK